MKKKKEVAILLYILAILVIIAGAMAVYKILNRKPNEIIETGENINTIQKEDIVVNQEEKK